MRMNLSPPAGCKSFREPPLSFRGAGDQRAKLSPTLPALGALPGAQTAPSRPLEGPFPLQPPGIGSRARGLRGCGRPGGALAAARGSGRGAESSPAEPSPAAPSRAGRRGRDRGGATGSAPRRFKSRVGPRRERSELRCTELN